MTTEQELFLEVKSSLKSYDEANLIDDITLRMWLRMELKSFGTNVMVLTDDIVEVDGGKAKLPEDFWRLKEAWKYTPSHFRLNSGSIEELERHRHWNHRVNNNHFSDCEEKKDCCIEEKIEYKGSNASLFYSQPTILRLTRGFNSKATTKDCINLPNYVKKKEKNEINIIGNTIQTEFYKGFIYIVYIALPTEQGELIIPSTQHDDLYKYLLTFLKLKVLEEMWLNNDDPNLGNKISYLYARSEDYRSRAATEMKAGILNPASWKTIRNTNRRRHSKYDNLIPKQNFRR